MEDPGWQWPFWKFGLKRDDLFTTLHDQYNTIPSSIQDPEAFHHDVFEISLEASTPAEFHRLLAARKEQRLYELNESLQSASLEIIANPHLIGTEQWQYALQLFRTRSLDSLVRYFASYLPENHPWHDQPAGDGAGDGADNRRPLAGSEASNRNNPHHPPSSSRGSFFGNRDGHHGDDDDAVVVTHEPLPISSASTIPADLPPSPRSMTMCSDESVDTVPHKYAVDTLTPARTLSFSDCDSDHHHLLDSHPDLHDDDDMSQPCDPESPATTMSEISYTGSYDLLEKETPAAAAGEATPSPDDDEIAEERGDADGPRRETESGEADETPTPRPDPRAAPFFDAKPSLPRRRHRSVSPSCAHPLSDSHTHDHHDHHHHRHHHHQHHYQLRRHHQTHNHPDKETRNVLERLRREAGSPAQRGRGRRTAKEHAAPAANRVRKPLVPDHWGGSRPAGRRRAVAD
ncbi:hypothetical protein VTK73DRAFT_1126 [Phialemonium thermophilum]|uniref:Uncharacterized protein n=1 Tax=Phialemonium thermophilum TaxID=223376 RepID=A0ABR3VTU6_9PEZI